MSIRGARKTRSAGTVLPFARRARTKTYGRQTSTDVVCPFLPICDPIVNDQIVKWDPTHLTAQFAASIAPAVDDYLKQAGLVPK